MRLAKNKRAVALIIVIFAMMIFAILGWTLSVMQSTDFDANLRNYDSGRALSLAETGAQWALERLSLGFNCTSVMAGGFPHSLNYGQYSCTCDDSVANQIIIESTGYVPSQALPRAIRLVKVTATQGAFTRSGTVKNLLNWYPMHSGSAINGKLAAGAFNGDDIPPYSDPGVDYGANLPPGSDTREITTEDLPPIDMNYLKTKAQGWGKYRNYTQTAVVANASNGSDLRLTPASQGIFSNITNDELNPARPEYQTVAVRVVGDAVYQWPNENSWVYITARTSSRRVTVVLKPNSVPGLDMSDWRGETVRLVKRFYGNLNNDKVWYVEGGDIIIDVRTLLQDGPGAQAGFDKTSLVAEEDILVSGSRGLTMKAFVDASANETYPNLATQSGSIYFPSYFTPQGMNENQRANNRTFDGLIYTNTGDVNINYINGIAIIGYNVNLDGRVKLNYGDGKYVDSDAFLGGISTVTWQEQ